jgi:hypothetical protein
MKKLEVRITQLSIAFSILCFLFGFYISQIHKDIKTINEQTAAMRQELEELGRGKRVNEMAIDELERETTNIRLDHGYSLSELDRRVTDLELASRAGNLEKERLTYLGEYTVTGFCECEICCGKWALNRPNGIVYGSSGVELIPDLSVAAPLPVGTRLQIDGKEYIVHDTTADCIVDRYDGKVIDIYKPTHKEAWNVGNDKHEVWMVCDG